MNAINFIFHSIAFLVNGFAASYQYFGVNIGHHGFLGKFKFLTFWNILFQATYFGLCVITDLSGAKPLTPNPNQRNALQRLRDTFHACVVFPATLFVFLSFWILYAIDRELVYPKALDAFLPTWLNHLLHTTIFPFIIVDKILSYQYYPKRIYGILGAGFVALLYLLLVLLVAYVDNFWVYPVLQVLGLFQRTLFILVSIVFFASFYMIGEYLTSHIWESKLEKSGMAGSKKKKSSKKV